ncbi:M4 family metallopeptidase [Micromonospora sp. PLK6-60]|uniref:M4 family metallopeptidase n=1 Tax=Micromonospora sp. PLK6-60 TaxID=2873383 RepID=UPI001CA69D7C|nr:M4 family metallopeptidase [Micromonospora sp. PLK6-60]MBY8871866.1 M4 family metallopeptidase [Micromonospora sp. PLK6-60]
MASLAVTLADFARSEVKAAPDSTITTDYRKDTYLSKDQVKLLDALDAKSTVRLRAESWPQARTVARLELQTPSGLDAKASLTEHATAFVQQNLALWNLGDIRDTRVTRVVSAGECSTVTFSRVAADKLVVANATMSVVLTRDGVIRGVAGQLTGEKLGDVNATRLDAAKAVEVVRAYQAARGHDDADVAVLPTPTPVVIDPFFLTGGAHSPRMGWLFGTPAWLEPAKEVPAGMQLVDQSTATVAATGPGLTLTDKSVAGCQFINPVAWLQRVAVDPTTGTPAWVGLGHLGVATQGATAIERARDLLAKPLFAQLYGTLRPSQHLRAPQQFADVGGRVSVRFQEYYAGFPVEGAYLTVTLSADGRAESISARFVTFPTAYPEATVTPAYAVAAANLKYRGVVCRWQQSCQTQLTNWLSANPPVTPLVILSADLFAGTTLRPGEERLVYRVALPGRVSYVDARGGGNEVFAVDSHANAVPYTILNGQQGDRAEITKAPGTPATTPGTHLVPANTMHPDSLAVSGFLNLTDAFYTALGRNSFDDQGSQVKARVGLPYDGNAVWCGRTPQETNLPRQTADPDLYDWLDCLDIRMHLGTKITSLDIVAHEFTHGVVESSTGFLATGEPGALGEHYADLMGNLVENDANDWRIAEDSPGGAVRDMRTPRAFGHPDHVAALNSGCWLCTHEMAGVPNSAAVMSTDGNVPGVSSPGIGRPAMTELAYATLVGGRLGPAADFLNHRVETLATCNDAVGTGLRGITFTVPMCEHIARAFDAVGVVAFEDIGWQVQALGTLQYTVNGGLTLYRGCTIAGQTLVGKDLSTGQVVTSNIAGGLSISFAGEWDARVVSRAAAGDPMAREAVIEIFVPWQDGDGRVIVDLVETYNKPPGVTDDQCRTPPEPVHRRRVYSTQKFAHWPVIFDGARGHTVINAFQSLPAGCRVERVTGLLYWRTNGSGGHTTPAPPSTTTYGDGIRGFTIGRTNPDQPRDLAASLHWWHIGTGGIFLRVAYDIWEPDGVDCLTAGIQANP